ncbi:MAG: hypothetical protein WCK18_00315 [Prolixibacteraceae bacterium]
MNTTFEITRRYTMKTQLISSAKKILYPAPFRIFVIAMILFLSFLGTESFAQGVGISESAITPDANAILELRSTLRGFLAPRLTTAQRTTLGLIPPSAGMLVYDSQLNTFYYWNGAWVAISAGAVANGLTLTPLATGFSIAGGTISKTLTLNNTLGFSGTDGTTMTFPTTSATLARTDAANTFTGHQTIEGVTATGATGTGSMVYGTSPTFTGTVTIPTPFTLGATSVTTNGAKLNYLTAATGTTGTTSTNLVFSTSPTLVSPILGVATGTSLSVTGQLTSTVATGTAPLVVTSTTPVSNLSIGGSAAKWTTARSLAGNSVDGSANVLFSNKFIVQGTTDAGLSGAQFMGALGTGIVKNTTTTGVLSIATNSDLPVMSSTIGGAVPTPPNNTTTFLRGDGTWGTPAGSGVSSFSAGTTGFTPNSATTGTVTLAGTLAVSNGGTGQTTAQAAINNLAGAVTSGQYLRGDGTNLIMSAIQAADVPTLNQNTTGNAATATTATSFSGSLVGDVSGNQGATTIGANKVTYAKIQTVAASSLLGNPTASAAVPSEITVGTGLSLNGGTLTASGSGGTVTSVAALTLGATGTDVSSTVASGTTTPVITLNIPTASASNRGALSSADWSTFNSKQDALGFTPYNATNPNSYIPLSALSSTATGLSYTNTTGVFSLTSGYAIPTTTNISTWNGLVTMTYPTAGIPLSTGTAWGTSITDNSANWNTAYTNRITSLTTTGSSGASTLISNALNIPNYTLAGLGGVAGNTAITAGTNTKITYDAKGLVTSGTTLSTGDIPNLGALPSLTLGTSNVAGAATTYISTNSTILAFDATVPVALGTAAVGTATVAARRDHVHPAADLSSASVSGILPVANGGTGQNTKALAFDALSPMNASGDLIYGGASGTGTRLAKGTDGQTLTLISGVPTWSTTSQSNGAFIPANFAVTTNQYTSTNASAFTVPAGITTITIEAVGGSGGGGGSGGRTNGTSGGGGGGGGGEYGGLILTVKPGDVIGVTVGIAGTAGAAGAITPGNGGIGGNGGQTIVTLNTVTVLTLNGGTGGNGGPVSSTSGNKSGATGGAGGTGSGSPNSITGGAGGTGGTNGAVGGTGGTSSIVTGGSSVTGGAGGASKTSTGAGIAGSIGSTGRVAISYL